MTGYCYGLGHHAEIRYEWTFPNGNVVELCVECCAVWRLNAAKDLTLGPAQIIEVR